MFTFMSFRSLQGEIKLFFLVGAVGILLFTMATFLATLFENSTTAQSVSLVAYWTFDEGSGTTAFDSSGFGNHGTLVNGPVWTVGKINGALDFDGSNDRVEVLNFDPPHQGTVALWVKTDHLNSRQRILGASDAYEVRLEKTSGKLGNDFFAAGSNVLDSSVGISLGQWHHLAFTYDLSSNVQQIYIDGALDSTSSFANDDPGGPFTFSIGTRTGNPQNFDGIIDDVRIYDRVLSSSEILDLFSGTRTPDTTPPIRSNGQPTGTLPTGTTQTTMSLTTNEPATCKYETTAGVEFLLMQNTFTTTGGTSHSTIVTGLQDGGDYAFYVRCEDEALNSNTDDFAILFSVAIPDTTPPVVSSIQSNPDSTSAMISWTTDEPSTSQVEYGTTTALGTLTTIDSTLVTSHSVAISGLTSETTYYYRVKSVDASGNETVAPVSPNSFVTLAPSSAVFPGATWETRTPAEVGLDAAILDQFLQSVEGNTIDGSGVIIKDGYLVKSWGCYTCSGGAWWSASKPVMSTMLLFALAEGKITSVDQPISDFGWSMIAKDANLSFRDLANNTSGYMLEESPGTAWAYNDYAINLYLKTLYTRVFNDTGGANAADSAAIQPNRLGALGLEDGSLYIPWSNGGWDIGASARDYARIAWFWLNKGNWNGQQLLPQSYFVEYMKVGVPRTFSLSSGNLHSAGDYLGVGTNGGPPNDGLAGNGGRGVYGFNWWFNGMVAVLDMNIWPDAPQDTFAALSGRRSAVVVFPSLNMVVAARNPNWQSEPAWGEHPFDTSENPADPASGFNQNVKLLVSAVIDTTAPAAPGDLTAQANGQPVHLAWTASSDPESGISSYRIYRDTVSGTAKTLVATVPGNVLFYDDSATLPNTTYYYEISAVNTKDLESLRSNEANALTGDDAPAAPTGLTATGGDTQVSLDWNDNVEADLSGYLIYRGSSSGGPYSQVASSTQSQFTDIGLTNGTTYYYVVTAVDLGNNESASSTEASAMPQEPPSSLVAHWAFDEGSETVAADSSGFGNDGTLVNGPVWITGRIGNGALDFDGQDDYINVPHSSSLNIIGTLTLSAWVKPDVFTTDARIVQKRQGNSSNLYGLMVTSNGAYFSRAGSGGTDVSFVSTATLTLGEWNHIAATYNDSTNTVKLYLNGVNTDTTTNFTMSMGTNTEDVQIGGQTGHTRWFDGLIDDVRIYNRDLTPTEIQELYSLGTDPTPPSEPSSLSAVSQGKNVDLSWQAATDAESGISGYKIYRKTGAGGTYSQLAQIGNTTTYTDSATNPNTTYFYQVSALNAGGLEGNLSNEAFATTGDDVPSAPSSLTATAGNQQVSLDWPDNLEADVTGYNVYRSLTSGGPYGSPIASNVGQSTHTDLSVTNGTTYYYVVTAVDTGLNESGFSPEVSATPQEPPSSLVGHWTFDEGSGTTASDSSGYGNTATLVNGPVWQTGNIGTGALNFDGQDDYINIPHSTSLNITGTLTLAAWVKPDVFTDDARIVQKRQGNSSNLYGLMVPSNGTYFFRAGSGGTDVSFDSTATLQLGQWNHIAATYDDSTNTVKLYLNGVNTDTTTSFTMSMGTNTEDVQVGGQTGHIRWFDGLIDDVRIYNRALSASEISSLYAGN